MTSISRDPLVQQGWRTFKTKEQARKLYQEAWAKVKSDRAKTILDLTMDYLDRSSKVKTSEGRLLPQNPYIAENAEKYLQWHRFLKFSKQVPNSEPTKREQIKATGDALSAISYALKHNASPNQISPQANWYRGQEGVHQSTLLQHAKEEEAKDLVALLENTAKVRRSKPSNGFEVYDSNAEKMKEIKAEMEARLARRASRRRERANP